MLLQAHLEEKPRVDFLNAHHPGPFAGTVRADGKPRSPASRARATISVPTHWTIGNWKK
jgi:hypothetical protein